MSGAGPSGSIVAAAPAEKSLDRYAATDGGSTSRGRRLGHRGIANGKAFAEDKRAELASDQCALEPRVIAMATGTTVNVVNYDRALHTLIFMRAPSRDTLTKMPFFNAGQVVASERLAAHPGLVQVTCAQHPWMHATIAVFGHPYYAVTDTSGRFTIDSLPPGTYTVQAWTQGLARPKSQRITINAGGLARVDMDLEK